MAIVKCPSCDSRMSSQSRLCLKCGFKRGEVAEHDLREFRRRALRDRIYNLNMASYAVLTLLLAAFGWYWVETDGFRIQSTVGPYLLFAAGAVTYLVIRILLFKFKLALRKLIRQ